MGDSPTRNPDAAKAVFSDTVTPAIAAWPFSLAPGYVLGVAFSGGADSTALLQACADRWPGRVCALHVNHGLQAAAVDFEHHCMTFCTALGVPLRVARVRVDAHAGESPEEAARRARYAALADLCVSCGDAVITDVVLAQHADDQVETVILALSRGAGLAGLSGMPSSFERHGLQFHRPLLGVRGSDLRVWLRLKGLAWIEDPSNADVRYLRNRIRHHVLPALEQVFPHLRTTFSRSARHAAQAKTLLQEVALADLALTGIPPSIVTLQSLSRARQGNALRHWLGAIPGGQARPSTAQLEELLDQVAACTTRGHRLHIKVGAGFICRDGVALRWTGPAPVQAQ
jgi:tRNA(Ile)-lysidine synthase